MASKYNFQYELVQYKWPRWLHQQTEKQRIIWGYKILFLDVLFPLVVDKFLFVDADQVSSEHRLLLNRSGFHFLFTDDFQIWESTCFFALVFQNMKRDHPDSITF